MPHPVIFNLRFIRPKPKTNLIKIQFFQYEAPTDGETRAPCPPSGLMAQLGKRDSAPRAKKAIMKRGRDRRRSAAAAAVPGRTDASPGSKDISRTKGFLFRRETRFGLSAVASPVCRPRTHDGEL